MIVIISIHFLIYLFIPLFSFFLFFSSHRVPSNLFQKLLLHLVEKGKSLRYKQAYLLQSGRWLSLHRNWRRMAVYQPWDSKTWYLDYWCVAHWFEKKGEVWTWLSGERLNISKWQVCKPDGNDRKAEISKNGGLFNGISTLSRNAFICETPGGKITFQP